MDIRVEHGCIHGGASFEAIGARFDDLSRRARVINADVLDAWFPPAPGVLATLTEHQDWLARTSPPTRANGLRAAIAAARGISEQSVLPGAGSSALIFLAMQRWMTPRSRVLLLDPAYGEYAYVLEHIVGCDVDRVMLREEDGWAPDLNALRARLAATAYDLFVIVNPNNPTGRLVPRASLERLVTAIDPRVRVWIDEAYIDYVSSVDSLETLAARSANVFVCKSMSKVYALSGARVAYLVGPVEEIAQLRRLTPPWSVGLPAQVAAVRALADPAYYAARYRETDVLREELRQLLALLRGVRAVTGGANFLLCHLDADAPTVPAILEGCGREGLFLRNVASMGRALGPRVFRTAVKDAATNARIVATLARILSERRVELPPAGVGAPAGRY